MSTLRDKVQEAAARHRVVAIPCTKYQAEDGSVFPSEKEAERHNAETDLRTLVDRSGHIYSECAPHNVVNFLEEDAEKLIPLLQEIVRTR